MALRCGSRRCSCLVLRTALQPPLPRKATSASSAQAPAPTAAVGKRLGAWLQLYEDLLGLTEVKRAQDKVIEAETLFLGVQSDRRTKQQELASIRARLKAIESELDKTRRGDDRYLELLTEEHRAAKAEEAADSQLNELERCERDYFAQLSAALRESHEKERARAERTRYWSLAGSLAGALVGVVGATLSHRARTRELREAVSAAVTARANGTSITDVAVSEILQRTADRLEGAVLLAATDANRLLTRVGEREDRISLELTALRDQLRLAGEPNASRAARPIDDTALLEVSSKVQGGGDTQAAVAYSEARILRVMHAYGLGLLLAVAAIACFRST